MEENLQIHFQFVMFDRDQGIGNIKRFGFTLEGEYELLLTQKLILQPRIELDFYCERDRKRRTGSGLSTASLGVRLRYEIKREIVPYIGVEWADKFGDTRRLCTSGWGRHQ